jgi:hypothetical protein
MELAPLSEGRDGMDPLPPQSASILEGTEEEEESLLREVVREEGGGASPLGDDEDEDDDDDAAPLHRAESSGKDVRDRKAEKVKGTLSRSILSPTGAECEGMQAVQSVGIGSDLRVCVEGLGLAKHQVRYSQSGDHDELLVSYLFGTLQLH